MRTVKPMKMFPRRSKVRKNCDKFLRGYANAIRFGRRMTFAEGSLNRDRTLARRWYLIRKYPVED